MTEFLSQFISTLYSMPASYKISSQDKNQHKSLKFVTMLKHFFVAKQEMQQILIYRHQSF